MRLHPKVPSYAMWVISPIRSSRTRATPAEIAPTTTDRATTGHTDRSEIVKSPSARSAEVSRRPPVSSSPGGDKMVPPASGDAPAATRPRTRNRSKKLMPCSLWNAVPQPAAPVSRRSHGHRPSRAERDRIAAEAGELAGRPHGRVALVRAHPVQHGREPLVPVREGPGDEALPGRGEFDGDDGPVAPVGAAPDQLRPLQPVHHAGDRGGGQP